MHLLLWLVGGYLFCKLYFVSNIKLGTHPTEEDGEVNRTVCIVTHLDQCFESYEISVKNCSGYYVYHLKQTKTNSEGYCFG